MTPQGIRALREHLHLTQEVFARILGVSFAMVNRWEDGKTEPAGDYARVLQTLHQLTAFTRPGSTIDWKRVGSLNAMAAVAGFSPVLTLGAARAPVILARLPSWSDTPVGERSSKNRRLKQQRKQPTAKKRTVSPSSILVSRKSESSTHARVGLSRR